MKNKITLSLLFTIAMLNVFAHDDLAIRFSNYTSGSTTSNDTIKTKFIINNYGHTMYHTGDTLYVSARLNNTFFGLDLTGTATPLVLTGMLHNGDSVIIDPGFILASQTLPFFPGATSLEVCVAIWGKGIALVNAPNTSFSNDDETSNNIACVTYSNQPNEIKTVNTIDVSVYPNPANHQVFFRFAETNDYTIAITNALGQTVKTITTNNTSEQAVNIADLADGVYAYSILNTRSQRIAYGTFSKR